jgi:hypothetical protein
MSRSGDECVVALTDQWYLVYGEEEWQTVTGQCLAQMELYGEEAKHAFQHCLGASRGRGGYRGLRLHCPDGRSLRKDAPAGLAWP